MEYILDSTTKNFTLPSGLALSITNLDIAAGGSVTVNSNIGVFVFPGATSLPLVLGDDFNIQVTGRAKVDVIAVGDQFAYRNMNTDIKPQAAGFYPGHWGTGIGSKPRNNPDSPTEKDWYGH